MPRGILATASAPTTVDADEAYATYEKAFADEPFVHLLRKGQWPQTKSVTGSNTLHVQVTVDQRQAGSSPWRPSTTSPRAPAAPRSSA